MKKILNYYGKKRIPILFVISFDKKDFYIKPLNELDHDIFFEIDNSNIYDKRKDDKVKYNIQPVSFKRYKKAFFKVQEEIKEGNTYLLNLTFPSLIDINLSLKEIYDRAYAKFKIYFKDKFVSFSPERFIKIKDNKIYTFPMKGTIDASYKNAKEQILNNQKEMAEHVMVVDLLRNDLNMVSKNVTVEKFRYVQKIKAGNKELLQVSSKIRGDLEANWQERLGEILDKILPAGSISGTPKKKSVELIKQIENYNRGFFTGIFGVFDGENLDSAVLIRFIQKQNNKFIYKSGGGITIDSNLYDEYKELKEKIYVPFF